MVNKDEYIIYAIISEILKLEKFQ